MSIWMGRENGQSVGAVDVSGTGCVTAASRRNWLDGMRATVAVTFACLILRACDTGTGDLSTERDKDVFELDVQW